MRSWRARLLMLVTAAAMLLAISGPAAMADNFRHNGDRVFFDRNDDVDFFGFDRHDAFDDGCIGVGNGFDCIGVDVGNDLFDEDFDTIDVGNLECLVEDGNDVDFCVNEDTNNIVFH